MSREQQVADLLRQRGYNVTVLSNAIGNNNGSSWSNGQPDAPLLHHFVCSLNPSQDYINGLVSMLQNGYDQTPGPVVNWFGDMHGALYLISDGPANHSGRGNSSVLARVQNDQAPLGPAATYAPGNDFNGNGNYVGIETQHPGDGTPWPDALLDAMVAWSAAHCIIYGWSANRAIAHFEHTDRKDDPSYLGGPNSNAFGNWLRSQVAARINQWNGNVHPQPQPTNNDSTGVLSMDKNELQLLIENAVAKVLGVAANAVNPQTKNVDILYGLRVQANAVNHGLNWDGSK